jgi:hypothetical protein
MWLKSHKWILQPYTAYEIRRELRVRESRHTVMLFDKKYFDVEYGKWIKDKLPKIDSYSLADIIDDSVHNNMIYGDERHYYLKEIQEENYSSAWFVPKDNDFDEECRLEEEEKNRKAHEEVFIQPQIEALKLKYEFLKEQENKIKQDEIEY